MPPRVWTVRERDARRLLDQPAQNVIAAADSFRRELQRARVRTRVLDDVLNRLERRLRVHDDGHLVEREDGHHLHVTNRRTRVPGLQPQGHERVRQRHQRIRIVRARDDVAEAHGTRAAGPVRHRHRLSREPLVRDHVLDRPRQVVRAASGRRRNDDVDGAARVGTRGVCAGARDRAERSRDHAPRRCCLENALRVGGARHASGGRYYHRLV